MFTFDEKNLYNNDVKVKWAYIKEFVAVLDHLKEAVVSSLVLAELALVGHADRFAAARRRHRGDAGRARRRGRQVEERRRQADGQIAGRHLVDRRQAGHLRQEEQERLQRLAVLVRHQQHRAA